MEKDSVVRWKDETGDRIGIVDELFEVTRVPFAVIGKDEVEVAALSAVELKEPYGTAGSVPEVGDYVTWTDAWMGGRNVCFTGKIEEIALVSPTGFWGPLPGSTYPREDWELIGLHALRPYTLENWKNELEFDNL